MYQKRDISSLDTQFGMDADLYSHLKKLIIEKNYDYVAQIAVRFQECHVDSFIRLLLSDPHPILSIEIKFKVLCRLSSLFLYERQKEILSSIDFLQAFEVPFFVIAAHHENLLIPVLIEILQQHYTPSFMFQSALHAYMYGIEHNDELLCNLLYGYKLMEPYKNLLAIVSCMQREKKDMIFAFFKKLLDVLNTRA